MKNCTRPRTLESTSCISSSVNGFFPAESNWSCSDHSTNACEHQQMIRNLSSPSFRSFVWKETCGSRIIHPETSKKPAFVSLWGCLKFASLLALLPPMKTHCTLTGIRSSQAPLKVIQVIWLFLLLLPSPLLIRNLEEGLVALTPLHWLSIFIFKGCQRNRLSPLTFLSVVREQNSSSIEIIVLTGTRPDTTQSHHFGTVSSAISQHLRYQQHTWKVTNFKLQWALNYSAEQETGGIKQNVHNTKLI